MTKNDTRYFKKYASGAGYEKQKDNLTFDKRLRELASLEYKTGKLLDLGCAFGFFLAKAEKIGFETYGIDISKLAIKKATKNCKAKLYQLDISKEKLPFTANFFDVVTMFDTLEHLENYTFALKEIIRVLKKGGVLYIQSPSGKRWAVDPTHLNYFTDKILKLILERSGFEILKIGMESGKLRSLYRLIRLIFKGSTNFNFVPFGGSFISCYAKKIYYYD